MTLQKKKKTNEHYHWPWPTAQRKWSFCSKYNTYHKKHYQIEIQVLHLLRAYNCIYIHIDQYLFLRDYNVNGTYGLKESLVQHSQEQKHKKETNEGENSTIELGYIVFKAYLIFTRICDPTNEQQTQNNQDRFVEKTINDEIVWMYAYILLYCHWLAAIVRWMFFFLYVSLCSYAESNSTDK